jgi:GTP-binding protein Era
VKTWKHVRDALHDLPSSSAKNRKKKKPERAEAEQTPADQHLALAKESLRELIDDQRVPREVRSALADDYRDVQAMLDKLEHGHLHIAVFGRVSVGKSATLNAMLGEHVFSTSPLHGETRRTQMAHWEEYRAGGVYLIDTPGINEVDGEVREALAHEVAVRSDLVVFIVDGDITETEVRALRTLAGHQRPLLLVLNKCDRYKEAERRLLTEALRHRTLGLVSPDNIVCATADPPERVVIMVDEAGNETETVRRPAPDIKALQERLWGILEAEGKTLAALNASLFAGRLSDQVTRRILAIKRGLAEKLVRTYCISKGVAVALNPVPVADLAAAALVDVSMVAHLSRLYGMPLTRNEAGDLVKTIAGQMALLMGTVWAVHLVSSVLKGASAGLSTAVTVGAQGAVAYYSTLVVGKAAERYFAQGKSWGDGGPKRVVADILEGLDRGSVLSQARADILARLKAT